MLLEGLLLLVSFLNAHLLAWGPESRDLAPIKAALDDVDVVLQDFLGLLNHFFEKGDRRVGEGQLHPVDIAIRELQDLAVGDALDGEVALVARVLEAVALEQEAVLIDPLVVDVRRMVHD